MRPWKLLGLAGLAGVAATGAVLARNERQRRAHTPEEIRDRLRARHAALAEQDAEQDIAQDAQSALGAVPAEELAGGRRHALARALRRWRYSRGFGRATR
jgi:hypothetical protein